MSFTIHTDSPYVTTDQTQSEGTAAPVSIAVNPGPQAAVTAGDARLLNS